MEISQLETTRVKRGTKVSVNPVQQAVFDIRDYIDSLDSLTEIHDDIVYTIIENNMIIENGEEEWYAGSEE